MDGFNEKKWFVYVGDHHEGPFSLAEIQEKMGHGAVTSSNYVWAEGMSDWKVMKEVPAFESVLDGSSASAPPLMSVTPTSPTVHEPTMSSGNISLDPSFTTPTLEEPSGTRTPTLRESDVVRMEPTLTTSVIRPAPTAAEMEPSEAPETVKKKGSLLMKVLIPLMILLGLAAAAMQGLLDPVLNSPAIKAGTQAASEWSHPYLMSLVQKYPSLGAWISPIPQLEDVAPEEYESLKDAALLQPSQAGPKAALALSKGDVFAPVFYVATNLPDGAQFEIQVEGVPDTLLNHLNFSAKVQATVSKKLGKSAAVRFPDGKPIPRGEYQVYLTETDSQPAEVKNILAAAPDSKEKLPDGVANGKKIIARRSYFLGGPKDSTYQSRLKEFHDKLRAKASAELSEVKQFSMTLEGQLQSSELNFTKLKKGRPTKAQQKAWNAFHTTWLNLDSQLSQTFVKWTPDALQNEYFYGLLYQLTQQAAQAVERVHGIHHAYFTGAVDLKSFDIQLGQAVSQAQTALSTLKAKIDQAEKIQPTANGMPMKTGLELK